LIFDPVTVEADLPEMIWLTEQYSGGEEMLLQYQIESYLGQRTSLVASGQGADLIFGGMPRHRLIALADRMPCLRGALLELYQQTQTRIRPSSVAGRALSLVQYRGSALDPLRVLGSSGLARVAEPASLRQFIATTHADLTSHGSFYDNVKVSPILPFMSDAVVRASLRIPARFKSTPFRQKIVLRKALEPLLPEAVRNRPKAIQKVRHDDRLTEVLSAMADRWLEPGRVAERGLLEPADVRSVRQLPALAVYRSDRLYRLWSMLSLEVWCTIFLDQRGRRIPRDGHR
jgi:asparagine synthase (glutamine-hydrolysing)